LGLKLNVLDTPGHTLSHIVYHNHEILFCGDTLFSLGCGRMFEGNAEQFHHSLSKIKSLDDDIKVYCTHEYTSSNLSFALFLEPENIQLQQFKKQLSVIRSNNQPSLPSLLKIEKNLNPFLRCNDSQIRKALAKITGKMPISSVDCFAQLRALKDNF
ncbi:MAG: MBL fold metallo-hydrolase, partial [Proteobacteria bacterium]|nr:MBL fold metallo-hydrolase [Pseudomonadota bacterium]